MVAKRFSTELTPELRGRRFPTIHITAPFKGQLVQKSTWLAARYEVMGGESVIGSIHEKPPLTLKRRVFIDLPPSIKEPVQVFRFVLRYLLAFS